MAIQNALFKLDDGDNPGWAKVKVLQKLDTAQARAIKAVTGYDLYRVEVLGVEKPSTFASNPKPGKKLSVSEKHLKFEG